ncbi:hypothetical protein [Oerskovia flava]|uniref:hypothetical protein n=1 Tax=Oerskovia flava TaxID=2986422 RepID=UPI00223FAAD7|nr:hypothetical protein [Oerskovia sp. JB1-3-2]
MGALDRARRHALAPAVLLAVGVGAVAAGCVGPWGGDRGGVTVDEVALWGPSVGAGDAALIEGRLTVDGGCVYITDGSGVRWLPVFNEDRVAWDGETLRTGDGAFVAGDAISIAGGVLRERVAQDWEPPEDLHVPDTCAPDAVWNGAS